MAIPEGCDTTLWQAFLQRQRLSAPEQELFVAYLTRIGALPIEQMQDLEDDYLDFLASGG